MSKMRGQKRQLEKARQERAAMKRDRRQGRSTGAVDEPSDGDDVERESVPQDVVLARLASLHERYADGGMSLDDFETSRAELLALLQVD